MENKIAVVVPCFRCRKSILDVLGRIGSGIRWIYVVDDKCPEGTGAFVAEKVRDSRVQVLFHSENQGVGGAVNTGYKAALAEGAQIIVKIDGDGQMDPALISSFVSPIASGRADYAKGNRFYDIDGVRTMPLARLLGNACLSFLCKLSSGYWDIFDPTNGYTAIHATALRNINLDKVARRYFFESDMLFRLGLVRAVVRDIPMKSVYGDEISNLRIFRVVHEFALRHIQNTLKRIFYNYFLRNFSVASLELVFGMALLSFGVFFGCYSWFLSAKSGVSASDGTVMLAALPIIIGVQFLLSFVNFDILSVPRYPLTQLLGSDFDSKQGEG